MVAKDQGKPPWGTDSKALTSSLIRPAHLAYTSTRYTERQGGENGGGRVCEPVFLRKHFFKKHGHASVSFLNIEGRGGLGMRFLLLRRLERRLAPVPCLVL